MFDSQKIDSYFEGKHSFEQPFDASRSQGVSWRRVFKLGLPCVAAALMGVLVVMPNIRKSVELHDNVTLPRKNEMEKLHIENTVFSSIDNKNRVNKIVADNVDETDAGSKIMRIERPRGSIPTENGTAEIAADYGFFNQNNNILDLHDNVQVVVENDTVISSASASYDFNKEFGWGDEPLTAAGKWGNMFAKAFTYDKEQEVLTLKGHNKITNQNGVLSSEQETKIFQNENKTVSLGNANVSQDESNLHADKIVAYFSDGGRKELVRAEAFGSVVVKTNGETATAQEGYYNPQTGEVILYGSASDDKVQKEKVSITQGGNVLRAEKITAQFNPNGHKDLQKAIAVGAVEVITPSEKAYGREGHYNPQNGEIVLYGDYLTEPNKTRLVTITQGENILRAEKITAYLDKNGENLQKADAVGRVEVLTPNGSARGDRGIYNPQTNIVELFENVRIEQNGNFIVGAHAETNLITSVSRITGNENTGGRIRGTFYKTRKMNNGSKAEK